MKMASKALAWSGSSAAPLVSSSSRSSSGVKALCFAPRSVSFPAKKISPLVNVIRAQKKEDSHTDDRDQRSSGQNQSDAAQGRPARESTRDIDLDDDSEFGELQSLVTKLMDIYQRKRSSDRNDSEFGELQSLATKLMDIYQGMRSSDQNDSEFAELQSLLTQLMQLMDIYQRKKSSNQNQSAAVKSRPAREPTRDMYADSLLKWVYSVSADDSEFAELQSLMTQLTDIDQGKRSSDQNQSNAVQGRPARESTGDIDLDHDSEFGVPQSLLTQLMDIDEGQRSSDQNQSAAVQRRRAMEDNYVDKRQSMLRLLAQWVDRTDFGCVRKPWRYSMTEEEYVLSCDMPGVDASELEVTILGDDLSIMFKGSKDKVDASGRKITGLYDTRVVLSPRWLREKAEAEFRDGTLYVRIPRKTIDRTVPIDVPVRVVV